ncbi:uncharacterized protein LOC144467813 [Augochlora pura]
MDPRSLSVVVILVSFVVLVTFVDAKPAVPSEASSFDAESIILDCKHSDYRTYIQCLKRHKRYPHDADHIIDDSCMEPCIQDCVRERKFTCVEICKHCVKRQKHRTINITETEYITECIHGNCTKVGNKDALTPITLNLTTHVHIHNHYNHTTTPSGKPHCPCYYIIWIPCYCRPQYQICQYQIQWPCIPTSGYGSLGVGGLGFGTGVGGIYGGGAMAGGILGGEIMGVGMETSMLGTGVPIINPGIMTVNTTCDECNPPAG